jgi:hydroxymethylpyrimidine/phosphomethylpyrimidine kinase
MKTALTIAGSDPTGGAGIQLDIKVFHRIGVHALSVITSITAQNTEGVSQIYPLSAEMVKRQLESLFEDISVEALKTGMLYSNSVVEVVSETLRHVGARNIVVDPVTVSSTGVPLVEDGTIERMMDLLIPITTVVTPNIYEASLMTGIKIVDFDSLCDAAKKILALGPEVVIITGGHFAETAEESLGNGSEGNTENITPEPEIITDLYYDGRDFHRIEGERFHGIFHGTGCTFSSALTAYLAHDCSVLDATQRADEFVKESIRNSYRLGKGMGILRV